MLDYFRQANEEKRTAAENVQLREEGKEPLDD
jgi:hypothetical protein